MYVKPYNAICMHFCLLIFSFTVREAREQRNHLSRNKGASGSALLDSLYTRQGRSTNQRQRLVPINACHLQLWSMAIGRFTYISPDDHDVTLPEINPQYDELPWIAPRVWRDIEAPGLALAHNRPAYISTCYHASIRLSLIQNAILRKLYALQVSYRSCP